mmetsp:Transcript_48819/g.157588  ORF Transcript_48819/g.157588 Transcript_48819/m.157588 type:complete len:85 (+) Transcript_48819:1470-1724(+)
MCCVEDGYDDVEEMLCEVEALSGDALERHSGGTRPRPARTTTTRMCMSRCGLVLYGRRSAVDTWSHAEALSWRVRRRQSSTSRT